MDSSNVKSMSTKAIAGWFGANRMLAPTVGRQLGPVEWCGVPFCGGCSELPYIRARSGIASDKHRHLVNMSKVVRDGDLRADLIRRLEATLFHPDELREAQDRCLKREADADGASSAAAHQGTLWAPAATPAVAVPADRQSAGPDVDWAYDYFIVCWMGRGGQAGTPGEFRQGISVRWDAGGGDSCTRFRSATASLEAWGKVMQPWTFQVSDAFDFLAACKDRKGHGLYIDSPWPVAGEGYRHRFSEDDQGRLADVLAHYEETRVVVRFGDHPLIRRLYPEGSRWTWVRQTSRDQANQELAEVLILNGESYAASAAA